MMHARGLGGWALAACLSLPALAVQAPARTALGAGDAGTEVLAPNVAAARRHYDKARADYAQGAYREAVTELEAARTLDPTAKDLVFNLAVVHEKLGNIDEALHWLRLYAGMNLTPQEAERAEAYTHRLEGAKAEVDRTRSRPAPEAAPAPSPAPSPPPPTEPSQQRPRFDTATIACASVAAAGLVVGVVLGVKALADQPSSSFVTGRDGTYSDLAQQADTAHAEAVAADVGFGVALAAGIAATYFYLSHSRTAPSKVSALAVQAGTTVTAAPLAGGAALVLVGRM